MLTLRNGNLYQIRLNTLQSQVKLILSFYAHNFVYILQIYLLIYLFCIHKKEKSSLYQFVSLQSLL